MVVQYDEYDEYDESEKDKFGCKKCGQGYTNEHYKWCKPCQINDLDTNWTSGNEDIDKFIQSAQLNIRGFSETVVEWIPYDQLYNIEEIGKDKFAIWKDGPLIYNNNNGFERMPDEKVVLKHLYGSKNIDNV
jgi:hypothetical protein